MSSEIVGILLAAGSSRRFGSDKRLHRLPDGMPMAVESARRLAAACPRTIAVVRPQDQRIAEMLRAAGCAPLFCGEAELGMGHSLAAGVMAAPGAAGWLVALADMPFIEPATYRAVIDALRAGASIAQPCHAGRWGHPVGFSCEWFEPLIALDGDHGARALLALAGERRIGCAVADAGIHVDIDLPADCGANPG